MSDYPTEIPPETLPSAPAFKVDPLEPIKAEDF